MDDQKSLIRSWYAIRTRSKQEVQVRDQLSERDIEYFLPLIDKWRKWSDRRKLLSVPLFSCYCFAHFSLADRLQVLQIRGVVEIVGNSNGPISIPHEEIEGVQRLIQNGNSPLPHPFLQKGTLVEVIHGPLTGLRGRLIRKGRKTRFVFTVDLIGQGASVEMDARDLLPLNDSRYVS